MGDFFGGGGMGGFGGFGGGFKMGGMGKGDFGFNDFTFDRAEEVFEEFFSHSENLGDLGGGSKGKGSSS